MSELAKELNELKARKPAKLEKFRIEIEDNDKIPPGGMFICGNGKTFLAQAGIEITVPRIVLEILDDAVEEVPIIDPRTMVVRRYIKRKKYPYTNHGPVTDEPRRAA